MGRRVYSPHPMMARLSLLVVVFALVPAACGGGDDEQAGTSAPPPPAVETEPAPPPPAEPEPPAPLQLEVPETPIGPGSRGNDVAELQRALAQLGLKPGKADGAYGPRTRKALRAFQRRNGLKADGVAGPKTVGAINKALAGAASATAEESVTTETTQ